MRKSIASISKSNYQITFRPPAVHSGWLENRVFVIYVVSLQSRVTTAYARSALRSYVIRRTMHNMGDALWLSFISRCEMLRYPFIRTLTKVHALVIPMSPLNRICVLIACCSCSFSSFFCQVVLFLCIS